MSYWYIKIDDACEKSLQKLDRQSQKIVLDYLYKRIAKLDNPKQLGKALRYGLKGCWRYRVDKFRIICELQEDKLIILIVKIGKRDEVYEN